ncbi:MAG: hypothetical protein ACPIOQ_50625, partial [Promethearchaeia archaeon]
MSGRSRAVLTEPRFLRKFVRRNREIPGDATLVRDTNTWSHHLVNIVHDDFFVAFSWNRTKDGGVEVLLD